MKNEIKKWIWDNLIDKCNHIISTKIKNNFEYIRKYCPQIFNELQKINIKTDKESDLIYFILNDLNDYKKCPVCGKNLKLKSFNKGFLNFCSNKCSQRSKETQDKIKNTCMERYNVDHHMKLGIFKEKSKKTLIDHYGVTNPMKSNKIKEKSVNTCLKRYGVRTTAEVELFRNNQRKTYREKTINIFLNILKHKNLQLISPLNLWINKGKFSVKCLNCNKTTYFKRKTQYFSCDCTKNSISHQEKEISNWLKSLGINVIENDRIILEGKELDVYLPEYSLAIEFDGLYWHSELFKDKKYHLNKTEKCKEKGIQLLHIFENEWENSREIVKSIILDKLGIFEKVINASDCIIKELDDDISKKFCLENDLDGYIPVKYNVGLFYEDELVQICLFDVSEEIKVRSFSKLNFMIVGGLDKLLLYYNFDNLVRYINLRYFDIDDGWYAIDKSEPNCWYWDRKSLKLENFCEDKGFVRIWDCGKLKIGRDRRD